MSRRKHIDVFAGSLLFLSHDLRRTIAFLSIVLFTLVAVLIKPAPAMHLPASGRDTISVSQPPTDGSIYLPVGSPSLAVSTQTINSTLLEGHRYYQSGQFAQALQSWQQAADASTQPMHEVLAWSYVSIAAQDLGEWTKAESAISQSLKLLAESPNLDSRSTIEAQVLNAQGRLFLKKGKPETAWEIWKEAEEAYAKSDDVLGLIGAQINQSQALQTMGLYRRAGTQLTDIMQLLDSQPDSDVKAIALRSLGNVLQTSGSLAQSEQYLSDSIRLAKQLDNAFDTSDALFSLANTQRLMGDRESAQRNYLTIEESAPREGLRTQAKLSRLTLLLESAQWQPAKRLLSEVYADIQAMPISRESIDNRVGLVESLLKQSNSKHSEENPIEWLSVEDIAAFLRDASQQAQLLQDDRARSLALGELGKIYGYTQQWAESEEIEEQALLLAQRVDAKDLSYRWQQQLGKAHYQQGDQKRAIASYSDAVDTLAEVRRDLVATNLDVQYSFRETVEPVYRELVSLLLLPDTVPQADLLKAREVIEELQLAELENYFRSACIDSASEYIDKLDNEAAVLYPIVLPDRVEVIASLPNQPLYHYRTWQSKETTESVVSELFQNFNPALSSRRRLALSEQIYDWLIRPAEAELTERKVDTLVFVLDGQFRNIPMAALYDGEQYLLEKYSVALTPGLKLLGPHFQDPKPLQALMMGLTEARSGFSALPGVKTEIEQVSARVNSEVLFDRDFTKENLASEIKRVPFPILHIATHGQFSSNLEKTFLLTWDQKLTLGDIDDLLRTRRQQSEPIELMVLSACQTAEGDERAALGLAGMAIRSGARSTIATLWAVNDESTASLMTQFYQELSETNVSKSEALRAAQIKILQNPKFSHPYYWSPFVLIGNWLS